MFYYYIFTIIVSWLYFFNKKIGYRAILISVPVFLFLLPSTGFDYDFYKESYDNATFVNQFPFFESISSLTAEPLYVWYSSAISVISQLDFPFFLALNFLICSAIILYALNKSGERRDIKYYLFLFLMPIVVPTIFYFSPRSSISFCFVFLGFFTIFFNKKFLLGLFFLFIGFSFHTQFLLISVYLILLYALSLKAEFYTKSRIIIVNFVIALFLFVFLYFLSFFEKIIATVFSFLPSASVAVSKLHYVSGEDNSSSSFRPTSLLSIIIYPIFLMFFVKKIDFKSTTIDKTVLFGLVGIVFFGMVVNLAFIGDPHVAGRLSRFSDYFCMGFLIPYTLYLNKQYLTIKFIAILMCALSPFLFKSLYVGAFELF